MHRSVSLPVASRWSESPVVTYRGDMPLSKAEGLSSSLALVFSLPTPFVPSPLALLVDDSSVFL
jgi:hypothetical protein